MNEIIPLVREHILKVVTIGWVLGCLCLALPFYLVVLIVPAGAGLDFSFGLTQVLLLPLILVAQGLFIGLIVRIGLGLYHFAVKRRHLL